MRFLSPASLWSLAALPLLLALFVARERARGAIVRSLMSERLRGVVTGRGVAFVRLRSLRPWLLTAGILSILVAVARPYAGFRTIPIDARESNRILAIDVSNSMAAEDVGTSRLSAARALATRLANAQHGRVGVIAFESSAQVISPLTTDVAAVSSLLETLQPGEVGEPGSDLGAALNASLELLESDVGTRADIVLLSDGEDQGGRVSGALARARARGVRVSTVKIGTEAGATIPTARGPLRNDSGEVVTTYARSDALLEIARTTGGAALDNPFADRALSPLLVGGSESAVRIFETRVPIERYQWPLGIAFLLFLTASLVHRGAE